MAWWSRKNKATELSSEKRSVPTGLFIKCEGCSATVDSEKIREALRCCPQCGHHFTMPTEERLALLLDDESAEEQDLEITPRDPLGFRDTKSYADRLVALATAHRPARRVS
jgi:acetyl-CoA carboxylase carboxyl transferase subunit beta